MKKGILALTLLFSIGLTTQYAKAKEVNYTVLVVNKEEFVELNKENLPDTLVEFIEREFSTFEIIEAYIKADEGKNIYRLVLKDNKAEELITLICDEEGNDLSEEVQENEVLETEEVEEIEEY